MREKNPFMVTFGREPIEYVRRDDQSEIIKSTFLGDPVTDQIFIITGVRGSGKTVLLYQMADFFEQEKDWITIRCTPTGDILNFIAQSLLQENILKKYNISLSVSVAGIAQVNLQPNASNDKLIIKQVLRELAGKGKRILITIDEITNTPQMQDFASLFQALIGEKMPVYFLGTGLYENIMDFQNVHNLTFLYRAPKITLAPLDPAAIARTYQKTLHVSAGRSAHMARLTLGYSFAFQALGFLYWNAGEVKSLEELMPDFDMMLAESVYGKLWGDMSDMDRQLCHQIAESKSHTVKEIRGDTDSNRFNQRRIRLKKQGVINTDRRGKITFALPRFEEFIRNTAFLYEG